MIKGDCGQGRGRISWLTVSRCYASLQVRRLVHVLLRALLRALLHRSVFRVMHLITRAIYAAALPALLGPLVGAVLRCGVTQVAVFGTAAANDGDDARDSSRSSTCVTACRALITLVLRVRMAA